MKLSVPGSGDTQNVALDTTPPGLLSAGRRWTLGHQAGVLAAMLLLLVAYKLTFATDSFPEALQYAMRGPIDEFADWVAETFRFILRPISLTIKSWLKLLDRFFLGWLLPTAPAKSKRRSFSHCAVICGIFCSCNFSKRAALFCFNNSLSSGVNFRSLCRTTRLLHSLSSKT